LKIYLTFALHFTEIVAQLVRAPDCGSGGRGFETRLSPFKKAIRKGGFFVLDTFELTMPSLLKEGINNTTYYN